jgi:hypothetical protein
MLRKRRIYHIDRRMEADDPPPLRSPPQPIPFAPPRAWMEKRVRQIARDDEKIIWGDHAFDRSDERDITDRDALNVLRNGQLDDKIEKGINPGEWKGKMTKAMRGRREIGVVVIILKDGELFVKTVEWEDLR